MFCLVIGHQLPLLILVIRNECKLFLLRTRSVASPFTRHTPTPSLVYIPLGVVSLNGQTRIKFVVAVLGEGSLYLKLFN